MWFSRLGDSHTMLYFNQLMNRQQILPLGLLWVSDGLYVIQTAEENKELLGHRLTAVGKAPVETVIDSLSTLFTVDNEAMVKSMIPQLFPSLQLLEYFVCRAVGGRCRCPGSAWPPRRVAGREPGCYPHQIALPTVP